MDRMRLQALRDAAASYLKNRGLKVEYGYVFFWHGQAYSWSPLLVPSEHSPGTLAFPVAAEGNLLRTTGGDNNYGAEDLEPVAIEEGTPRA